MTMERMAMTALTSEAAARISLNQRTTARWSVLEAAEGCRRAGVGWIGLWREDVAAVGLESARRAVDAAGLRVSSLCRGGFFPAAGSAAFEERLADNRAAVDEAAALGTEVLVLVCGGMVGGLATSRQQVADALGILAPYAGERGVRLAIEPMHPMYCADRSVIVTLGQALDLAEQHPVDQVGVVVDTFHLWWDPDALTQIARAGARIASYQVCDWLDPLPDLLLGRGLPGDGVIDIPAISDAVTAAGYEGPIEVEVFNADVWERPGDAVVSEVLANWSSAVLGTDR
jgi:sugar phosphate isomerase/epimerase